MTERFSYLSVSQAYDLNIACIALSDADIYCYQVGSTLTRRDWRDVDLRAILDDGEYDRMIGDNKPRLLFLNTAISEWLSARTGLPVDFQFQKQSDAKSFAGPRNFMGARRK